MKKPKVIILTLAVLMAGSMLWVAVPERTASAQPAQEADSNQAGVNDWSIFLPEGGAKATAVKVCFSCHGLEQVVTLRGDTEFWSSLVWSMVSNGADLSKDEAESLIKYYGASFPPDLPKLSVPININTADVATLRLLAPIASHAEDIVKARAEKKFDKPDDLTTVPGIMKQDVDKVRGFITAG